jgi:hypothetical protein
VIVLAALTVLGVAGGGDGPEASPATSPTSTLQGATPGDSPAPPWGVAVPRSAVRPAYGAAWDRARNRAVCALLFPLDGGPALAGAKATGEKTPDDNGWDILLTGGPGSVEVLGLFDRTTSLQASPDGGRFTKTWADGSVARYAVDVGNAAPGTFDPNSSPFEAVLTIPGQSCGYRLYDSLGKDHLESLFDRLRLMAP